MKYFILEQNVLIEIKSPRRNETNKILLGGLNRLPTNTLESILISTQRHLVSYKYATQQNYIYVCLKSFGDFLVDSNFNSEQLEWQLEIPKFAKWFASRNSETSKLETRCDQWRSTIYVWIMKMMDDGIIPTDVKVPTLRLPRTLGAGSRQDANSNSWITGNDNTIFGEIVGDYSENYLDTIRSTLTFRNESLKKVLDQYFLALVKDFRRGRQLMRKIQEDLFHRRKSKNDWQCKSSLSNKKVLVTSDLNHSGVCWILKIMNDIVQTLNDTNCLSTHNLQNHPAFNSLFLAQNSMHCEYLKHVSALTKEQANLFSQIEILHRFCGILNMFDVSTLICMLIQEHPNFNPESIGGAKIVDADGKSYFIVADQVGGIFSVDKPRATSRKYGVMTKRSRRVFKHILRCTLEVRKMLKKLNDCGSEYLFIAMTRMNDIPHTIAHPFNISLKPIKSDKGLCLSAMYPSIKDFAKHLSFEKIRASQGVLSWFHSGSVAACARTLGNRTQTSLEYYIPNTLIRLWNERLIRRFQNTLIALSGGVNSLVKFGDINDLASANNFIAQLVNSDEYKNSALRELIDKKFSERFQIDIVESKKHFDLLCVNLSETSLKQLFLLRRFFTDTMKDPDSRQLYPEDLEAFLRLADFIEAIATREDLSEIERELFHADRIRQLYKNIIDQVTQSHSVLLETEF